MYDRTKHFISKMTYDRKNPVILRWLLEEEYWKVWIQPPW